MFSTSGSVESGLSEAQTGEVSCIRGSVKEVWFVIAMDDEGDVSGGLEGSSGGIRCGCEGELLLGVSFSGYCGGEVDE